jgi:threonine aldolase
VNFCSDNTAGIHPTILDAIGRANEPRNTMPYGADDFTAATGKLLNQIFEREVTFFAVATGTAANTLGLAAITPPYGAIYCHEMAHVQMDECGAPEFYTGGAKLVPLPGANGKLEPAALDRVLRAAGAGVVHHIQPASVSLTQATEAGTVYTPAEVGALADVAQSHKLRLHMDGTRLANALAHLRCSPADATWRAGVDVLSLGATKNGAMAAEAVVVFDKALAESMPYRRKRGGHLFSKMRFLTAQLAAYLSDDLWMQNARHANAQAARLAQGLGALPGVRLLYPVQANELFPILPLAVVQALEGAGFRFYEWPSDEAKPGEQAVRLVTAFSTDPAHVEKFVAIASEAARKAAA